MKTLAQTIFLMLMTSIVYGQDLTGHWHGALDVQGNKIRIIFHFNKMKDQYEATMDSPDQNISGTKVTTTNFSYPDIKFEISTLGAVYEGTMTDKDITGKWMQSGTALFLVLSKNEEFSNKEK